MGKPRVQTASVQTADSFVVRRSGSVAHGFIRGTQASRDMNKPPD
jgi:hypothetical protein